MGSFRIDVEIGNPAHPGARSEVRNVLVDTGAELSCFPADLLEALGIVRGKKLRLRQADGSVLERWTGSGIVYAANTYATDDLVFGEPADLVLLGARTLEGLNLRVDPVLKRLVDSGPMPFAGMSS
jgi:predicted aspartyl protease